MATVVAGDGAGNRLLVWPAGHTRGDLGQPRLNQRAALYAEALLDKGKFPAAARKQFDVAEGSVEVAFEFHAGRRGPAAGGGRHESTRPRSSALRPPARRAAGGGRAAHDARRLLPLGRRHARDLLPRPRRARAARVAGAPAARARRHQPRQVPLRGGRSGDQPGALLARLRVDLRRVGDDRRGARDGAHLPRVAALPGARLAGAGGAQEARRAQRFSRGVVGGRRPEGHVRRHLGGPRSRPAPRAGEERPARRARSTS